MPTTRASRTKNSEDVPGEGHPDRKRVLNVLAQRRYRQRRRKRIAALEAQASGTVAALNGQGDTSEDHHHLGSRPDYPGIEDASSIGKELNFELEHELMTAHSQDLPTFCTSSPPVYDAHSFELSLFEDYTFPNLPTPLPSTPTLTPTPSSPPFTLPLSLDGALLSVPILAVLRAFSTIAVAFDVATHVWDLSYLHVLPPRNSAVTALPANLHPIPAQYSIPHHPMLDLLPWPGVRERLICMLSMPSALRPLVAREDDDDLPTGGLKQSRAIAQLIQDLDENQDGAGLRVHGNSTAWAEGNELREDAWEIGEVFCGKWWWCLERGVVEASNRRRRERGLPRLRMAA